MDIFISYRRRGGSVWADLLNTKLSALGLKVFYDKFKIENEDFTLKIKRRIQRCPNFLIVLSPSIFSGIELNGKETDWVLEEIKYALSLSKNIICVQVDGFIVEKELTNFDDTIKTISQLNMLTYNNDTKSKEEASIMDIVAKMVDSNGKSYRLGEHVTHNSWYDKYEITDEDLLWIKTDYSVCHQWDQKLLKKICSENIIAKKENGINLFVLKMYDVETYQRKYNIIDEKTGKKLIDNVYGITYASDVEFANKIFGENHFIADNESSNLINEAKEVIKKNGLSGFDIIDMTLIIKDLERPEKIVREMSKLLHETGGIIFIRELDDDFVRAYPNEELILKMLSLLELDPGAGNRHTGKKIYTFLKLAGADKVYISDEIISTANHKSKFQKLICDTYFSYLKPELRNLCKEDPDTYKEAYNWIEKNYDRVENLFCSSDFYFRAGFISGYGVFENEDDN